MCTHIILSPPLPKTLLLAYYCKKPQNSQFQDCPTWLFNMLDDRGTNKGQYLAKMSRILRLCIQWGSLSQHVQWIRHKLTRHTSENSQLQSWTDCSMKTQGHKTLKHVYGKKSYTICAQLGVLISNCALFAWPVPWPAKYKGNTW